MQLRNGKTIPAHGTDSNNLYHAIPHKNFNSMIIKILSGVTIEDNSIIGTESIVTKSIPDNIIAVGNPCRIIRKITEENKIDYLKKRN